MMVKIFWYILFCILIWNEIVQGVPLNDNGDEDIMVASSRLHREADRFHYRVNPIDNVMDFPSNHYLSYLKRNNNYVMPRQVVEEEEEPETVYVNMKVDSEEEQPETQYVNLFINSK